MIFRDFCFYCEKYVIDGDEDKEERITCLIFDCRCLFVERDKREAE